MNVARRQCPGQTCDLHQTSATKLSSILGYDHWGGTSPLHHSYTLACTLIGARQHRPFSSFTSPPSTQIFDKTSHPPPHTPNSFAFRRVQTPLTQSSSRVQTQINHSFSRAQARFAPQGFWPSYPQTLALPPSRVPRVDTTYCALPHPRFVPYSIPDLGFYITYLFRYNTTQYMFLPCAGFNPPEFLFLFYIFIYIFFFSVALRPTCVMLSCYISSPVAFDRMTLILFTFTSSDPNHSLTLKSSDSSFHPKNSDSTHFSLS